MTRKHLSVFSLLMILAVAAIGISASSFQYNDHYIVQTTSQYEENIDYVSSWNLYPPNGRIIVVDGYELLEYFANYSTCNIFIERILNAIYNNEPIHMAVWD